MRKFCGKAQFPPSFWRKRPNLRGVHDITLKIFLKEFVFPKIEATIHLRKFLLLSPMSQNNFLGSKACKTPLNFLTVKLLWYKFYGNTEILGRAA